MHRNTLSCKKISSKEHNYCLGTHKLEGNEEENPLNAADVINYKHFNNENNGTHRSTYNTTEIDRFEAVELKELMIEPVINVVQALGVIFRTNICLEKICETGYGLEITPMDDLTLQRGEVCNISYLSESCKVCLKDLLDSMDKVSFFDDFGDVSMEISNISSELESMHIEVTRDKGGPEQMCMECYHTFLKMRRFRTICKRSQNVLDEISEFTTKQLQNEFKLEKDIEFWNVETSVDTTEIKQENSLEDEAEQEVFDDKDEGNASFFVDCEMPNNVELQTTFECIRCGRSFRDNQCFIQHMQYDFCVDTENPKCRMCNKHFTNIDELDRHLETGHTCFYCKKCSKSFTTLSKFNRHQRYHQSFTCDFCAQIFYSKRSIRDHLKSHIIGLYPCVFCDETFGSRKRLGIHKNKVHPNDLYKCPHCIKEFKLKDTYRCHLMTHNPDKPHKCTYCEKQFVFRHHLENHIRSHTKVNPFLCNFCGKTFRVEVGLRAHLAHHDPKMYPQRKSKLPPKARQCDMCNYSSNQSGNLKKHKIKYHGEAGEPSASVFQSRKFEFICDICDKQFKLATSLENHLITHNEVRDYHCPLCKSSFRKQTYLRLHIDGVHLKLRPNKCNKCDAAYLMSNDLKRHMMQKHPSSDRAFQCYYCQKTFMIPQYLKNHINRVHNQEKNLLHQNETTETL